MKRFILSLASLVLVCTGAAAQGNLLKGLGQKALNKVENAAQKKVDKKVDQTVDKAVDKALESIFGKKPETPQQQESTATASYEEEYAYSFAGSLMYENMKIDNFAEEKDDSQEVPVYTYPELVKYRPAWPSGADLANRAALEKYAEKVQDYSLSAGLLLTSDMTMKAMMALGQQSSAPVDNSIHSEKAQAIAEELVKISEARSAKAQPQSMSDGLRAALRGDKTTALYSFADAMSGLKTQIVSDWHKSAEFKKINAIEESGKSKAVRVKEQSAIIDSWNKAQLEKWVAALKDWEKENFGFIPRVVELDAQLEALPEAEKRSPEYKIAKSHANGLSTLVFQWVMVPSEIFTCPYVEYPRLEEDY